jgi:hypothetical protein
MGNYSFNSQIPFEMGDNFEIFRSFVGPIQDMILAIGQPHAPKAIIALRTTDTLNQEMTADTLLRLNYITRTVTLCTVGAMSEVGTLTQVRAMGASKAVDEVIRKDAKGRALKVGALNTPNIGTLVLKVHLQLSKLI